MTHGQYTGWCTRCGGDCYDGIRHRCPPPIQGAKELRAEIERLRGIETAAKQAADIYEAEIERLRTALTRINSVQLDEPAPITDPDWKARLMQGMARDALANEQIAGSKEGS